MTYEQQINEEWTRSIFGSLEQQEFEQVKSMPLSAY
jgi:hypothetical protein